MYARRQADLSQIELAAKLGVSSSDVSRWEKGRRQPRLSMLQRIAEVCAAPWLLDLSNVSDLGEPPISWFGECAGQMALASGY